MLYKIWVDASFSPGTRRTGVGIRIVDEKDNPVKSIDKRITAAKTSSLAEFYAVVHGVIAAKEYLDILTCVRIYSDSQETVRMVKRLFNERAVPISLPSGYANLFHNFREHLFPFWQRDIELHIKWVPRKKNSAADKLASQGRVKKMSKG